MFAKGRAVRPDTMEGPQKTSSCDPHMNVAECNVTRDRAALLYAQAKGGLMVSAAASSALVLLIELTHPAPGAVLWLAVMAAVLVLRGIDVVVLHPARTRVAFKGDAEIARFALGLLSVAVLWAVYPVLFFFEMGNAGRTASAIILAALAGGSATVLGPSLVLARIYCAAQIFPGSIMFLLLPGRENMSVGLLGIAMTATMLSSVRVAHRSVVGALRVSRANQALTAEAELNREQTEAINSQLKDAQTALNEANQSLEQRIAVRTADLAHEVGERMRYAEALARLASTDPLTGLCNRSNFTERLAYMLADAEKNGTGLAVLFLDLDNFKQVNDVRGHAVGDRVLQKAACLLSETAGGRVEIARWGGDEFVMAMPTSGGSTDALALGNGLRQALEAPFRASFGTLSIDLTVGISMFPEDGLTQDELIRAADVAMYEAKKEGKGRVKLFDPALAHNIAERHTMEQALRQAIHNDELSLAFQPIVSARTGVCEAFEALLRWNHPALGAIGPATFIPIAEQSGQIFAIGRWVLFEACRIAASWPGASHPVTVNVSMAQVLSGSLLEDVHAALKASSLPSSRLQIEITESMFVGDHVRVTPIFEALRSQGVRILLDDFGTGFSSLAYLGKLPIDVIKIDQSFVRVAERDGYAIIGAILSIASALSLQVTAEGVETPAQRTRLAELGVERLQGYLISRPLAALAVPGWLIAQAPAIARRVYEVADASP